MYPAEAWLELEYGFLAEEFDGCSYLVGCCGSLLMVWTIIGGKLGQFLKRIRGLRGGSGEGNSDRANSWWNGLRQT
ncbi:hypothetical protein EUGRSUZ_E03879 [Eucalyptus grandis]|uniref:Uncharacterized protein n=2 Tax=Eucalyptus grandis TaxID=71139 RepID=A0A059C9I6_EUCGR|nr:hypothetical protein EUGRSUZ_E03879 [Eucalyptus grandis]